MIDHTIIWQSVAVCSLFSGVVLFSCSWPWREIRPRAAQMGYALGIGGAVLFGMWWLGISISWPPTNHEERIVLLILPTVVAIEVVIATVQPNVPAAWALRVLVASAIPGVLLQGHQLLQSDNPDFKILEIRTWNPAERHLWLLGAAVVLVGVWWSLTFLLRRHSKRIILLAIILSTGAALWASYSAGYATNYRIGLPVVVSLFAAWVVSWLLPDGRSGEPAIGIGVAGLFCVLMGSVFYSAAPETSGLVYALPILLAPMSCWFLELSVLTPKSRWRDAMGFFFVVLLLLCGIHLARPATPAPKLQEETIAPPETNADWYEGPEIDMSLDDLKCWKPE